MRDAIPEKTATPRPKPLRLVVRVCLLVAALMLAKLGFDAIDHQVAQLDSSAAAMTMAGLMIVILVGYAIMLAIPFIPGIEIGLAVLMMQGASAAPYVYLATVAGLALAFLVGQLTALDWLIRFSRDLGQQRITTMLEHIRDTPRDDRLDRLRARLPGWLAAQALPYRYVMLGIVINLPGNALLGGGGGIMLAAGISRLFHSGLTMLTISIATLPVPLAVWFLGADVLH